MLRKSLLALAISGLAGIAHAETPTNAQMYELIKQQQAQIEALQKQLQQTDKKFLITEEELGAKIEATATAVEQNVAVNANSNTTIGGYGEVHLNRLQNQLDGGEDKNEIDVHRFVLFFGHQFSDTVRLYSELEVEHTVVEGDSGAVELEQAYIEWDYAGNHSLQAGLFLLPVGILNETHEPNTFYGVERNNVEKNIIPVTWWEAGVNFKGELAEGWSYNAVVNSGLYLQDGDYKVRDGRGQVAEARADNYAFTGRLKYTGIAGVELAATLQYQDDMLQGDDRFGSGSLDATLVEAHATYQHDGFQLRALYAQWDLDNMINQVADGASQQKGWYLEPAYRINDNWGVFARYSEWDNQADSDNDSEYSEWSLGANFWLTDLVVFKADWLSQDTPDGKDEFKGVNLGVGYSF